MRPLTNRPNWHSCVAAVLLFALVPAATRAEEPAPPAAAIAPPKRERGTDWPCFLGPTGDSKSTETGILTRWPADGPPLVWQLMLGTGYCMPAISDGRLYQFDRVDDQERLRCLDRLTGASVGIQIR